MPELLQMSSEFKRQFNITTVKTREYHGLQPSVIRHEHEAISKIKAAILSHGNPFAAEGDQLYNFITHAYVPQEFVSQILTVDETGQRLYEDYVAGII